MTDRFPFVPPAPRLDSVVDPGVPTPARGVASGQVFTPVCAPYSPAISMHSAVVGKTAPLEWFQLFHASVPECHPLALGVTRLKGALR
jgi:hypothetical protein